MSAERGIPFEELPQGDTLFVSSDDVEAARDLVLGIMLAGSTADDRMLLTTNQTASDALLSRCERFEPDLDFTDLTLIDCTDPGQVGDGFDAHVESHRPIDDLTGLGVKFSVMYDDLGRSGGNRVLAGLFTVSTLLNRADLRPTVRFLQTVSGRIEGTSGVGLFVLDERAPDDRSVDTLRQVADGWIDVRSSSDGTAELRVTGIPETETPSGWIPFTLPD